MALVYYGQIEPDFDGGAAFGQGTFRTRHMEHVAERREDDIGLLGKPHGIVDPAQERF